METSPTRQPYVSDVTDEEWDFVVPYLSLMKEGAPQRHHSLRELFNGLRYIARGGLQWRLMPHDLPPWHAVYQQTRRWLAAGVFEAIIHDLRELLRLAQGRAATPTAAILAGAYPDDDEVAARVRRNGSEELSRRRICVDLELRSDGLSGRASGKPG